MDKLTVSISAVLDDDFTNKLRELIRDIVKEEIKNVNAHTTINVSNPKCNCVGNIDLEKAAKSITDRFTQIGLWCNG